MLENTILGFLTLTSAMKVFAWEIPCVVRKIAVGSPVAIVCEEKFAQVLLERLVLILLTREWEPTLLSREMLLLGSFLGAWRLIGFCFLFRLRLIYTD